MALDNSLLVAPFCPEKEDGDTFIYTETLNRGQKKGNNGHRLLKTFYHRSVEEFWEQWPTIKALCDMTGHRACTRLAKKSYERVGKQYAKMVMEAVVSDNWAGMKSLYNRACGITPAENKIWLFDVDIVNDATLAFGKKVEAGGHLLATIPSKKGLHYVVTPFDVRTIEEWFKEVGLTYNGMIDGSEAISLHRDNPTNLYIPDGAD